MKKKPILIQTAMKVECQEILKKLKNLKELKIQNYQFYEGEIDDYSIVVILSKVGVIHTSSSLTIAINKYHPIAIINVGIAGSLSKEIHTKDIVIGESCININSYRTPIRKEHEGSNPEQWELLTFLSGEEDKLTIQTATQSLIDITKEIPIPKSSKLYYGRLGSGDVWNREADRMIFLNKKYQILCEDMESIATYTIANNLHIPVISLKMISDNFLLNEEYNREVGKDIQHYAMDYIKQLINNILKKRG